MKQLVPLIFALFYASHLNAAQTAVVKSRQAIIYADQEMKSPIGHISQGKQVRVGEIKRNKGQLLPIIVSGKIGWIKVEDLALSGFHEDKDEGPQNVRVIEHNVEKSLQGTEDKLSENNFIVFSTGQYALGDTWDEVLEKSNSSTQTKATQFQLHFEHRPPFKRWSWGIGLSYAKASEEYVEMTSTAVEGILYWSAFQSSWVSSELFAGLTLSFDTDIVVQDVSENEGSLYGYNLGGQFRFLPQSKIGLVAGVSYRKLSLEGLENINTPNGDVALTSFSGIHLFAGLHYKF